MPTSSGDGFRSGRVFVSQRRSPSVDRPKALPMRVLLVSEPGGDGVFRHVRELCHYLVANGVEVHLAYSDRRASDALPDLVDFVAAHGGQCLNLRVVSGPRPGDIPALGHLRRFARQVKPDIIHGHSSKAGVLARALRLLGFPAAYCYTPHAYYGLYPRNWLTPIYNGIERLLARAATTIHVSDDERRFGADRLGIPPELCVTIPNSCDTDHLVPGTGEQRRNWRLEKGLPKDAVVIGNMARLCFQKDPETLYRALAQALAEGRDLYLFHAGQGELAAPMEELARELGIEKRVIRRDYFRDPAEFYRVLDGLILTSRYEGLPLTMLEGLSCDLPLVCGTGPGTSDIANAGLSHCWTAGVGDVAGFSRAIGAWLDDRPLHRPSNHRKTAQVRYSPKACYGAILALYQALLLQGAARSD